MKKYNLFLLILIIAFLFSCSEIKIQTLPKNKAIHLESLLLEEKLLLIRASKFNKCLESVSGNVEKEVTKIASFINPNEDTMAIALDYYHHWFDNKIELKNLTCNIVKVSIVSDSTANLVIRQIWETNDKTPLEWISETDWIKTNGNWYRTIHKSKLLFESKVVNAEQEEQKYHLNLENF